MSGPKTSRYVLTEEQRKRIAEQQRIIRETQIAQKKCDNLLRKCSSQISDIDEIIEDLKILCTESGKGIEELHSLKTEKSEAAKLIVKNNSGSLESLNKENQRLEMLLRRIQQLKLNGRNVTRRIGLDYQQELSDIMSGGFNLSFAGLGKDQKIKDNPFVVKINKALAGVEDIELTPELEEKFSVLRKRADEIKNLDFLENFCSMQVYPFVHDCEFYRDHIDEFEELLAHYSFLTAEVGEPEKFFTFSEENIGKLQSEISRLNQIMMSQKEQEYISTAVDEAMIEMGYELIGEKTVTKKNGKKFRNGLYTLEEGTAVNVTFSDSGQISMELGALDILDRVPTEAEAAELAKDMHAFCSDYAALEKKLAEKGITTNRISILPPSEEYAQIFNTSDYDLKRQVDTYKKRRKKAAAGKQLYKEG
ncbi:MAG: hypothetical protein HDR15_01325 [Lachnospiraceae bacterium]|nr:hypothetical protein [Lachnospiraceae bacterium]